MQIGILEKEDFPRKAVGILEKIGATYFFDGENLSEFVRGKDVLFVRLGHFIGKEIIQHAKDLKFLCTPTTGLNHIDIDALEENGIVLISLKGEYDFLADIRATPEHTFGLVLALLRKYKTAFLHKNNNSWDRDKFKGYEIYNKNIGIIGFGRIGKILAQYFSVFGANVFFYDSDDSIKEQFGAKKSTSVEELIKKSKIVLLCASFSQENEGFFNKEYIDLLKDKYFINTSRGELIEEDHLIKRIEEDYFKGVALDVISDELGGNNLEKFIQLTEDKNLILTPHIGGVTYESMQKTEVFIAKKLNHFLVS